MLLYWTYSDNKYHKEKEILLKNLNNLKMDKMDKSVNMRFLKKICIRLDALEIRVIEREIEMENEKLKNTEILEDFNKRILFDEHCEIIDTYKKIVS